MLNSMDHAVNPFRNWATVTDCGDIRNTPFDKLVAVHELEKGMAAIHKLKPKNESVADAVRLITIGGDHTVSKYFQEISCPNSDIIYSSAHPSCSSLNLGLRRSLALRQSSRHMGSQSAWWRIDQVF